MTSLFILILVGFGAAKLKMIDGRFSQQLSVFVINISSPCLIVSSVLGDISPDKNLILPVLGIGCVTYAFFVAVAMLLSRLMSKDRDMQGIYGFMLTFFLFYVFCCAISISAVVFVLLSEMYPNRVRGLAMSVAGLALWVGTYLIGQLTPWMLENLTPAGTFFLFAAMCIPYILIMWKAVPETTGKSLEEIEEYWKSQGKKKA